jgi:hypothetical protein
MLSVIALKYINSGHQSQQKNAKISFFSGYAPILLKNQPFMLLSAADIGPATALPLMP